MIHRGDIPDGLQILHRCDVSYCVNPEHLFMGTHEENMRDMKEKGRRKGILIGENHPAAKLSNLQTYTIVELFCQGIRKVDLAKSFGVSHVRIGQIVRKEGSHISHTVTIDVKFKNQEAAVKAATACGARILGEGTHRLYASSHAGFGVQFKGWNYPAVIDKDGKIFYDNYNGSWGSAAELEKFQEMYSAKVIEAECEALGWYHERNEATGELVVHHPAGGTITVTKGGTLDASGFVGNACEQATERFEAALGTKLGAALKPYLNEVRVSQNQE